MKQVHQSKKVPRPLRNSVQRSRSGKCLEHTVFTQSSLYILFELLFIAIPIRVQFVVDFGLSSTRSDTNVSGKCKKAEVWSFEIDGRGFRIDGTRGICTISIVYRLSLSLSLSLWPSRFPSKINAQKCRLSDRKLYAGLIPLGFTFHSDLLFSLFLVTRCLFFS